MILIASVDSSLEQASAWQRATDSTAGALVDVGKDRRSGA